MNIYFKYCPNVFVAKCDTTYNRGDVIQVTTKYGKENDHIVFNLVAEGGGFFYYSIVRADGLDAQEYAKRKADKLIERAEKKEAKSDEKWEAADEGKDFLVLAEPIKIGHHSEKRHRALIERNHNRMNKAVELQKEAETLEQRAEYWSRKANDINLSMPESLDYYEFLLEGAKQRHEGLKNGTIPKEHSYSLTYAKKEVNEIQKKLDIAKKLWE